MHVKLTFESEKSVQNLSPDSYHSYSHHKILIEAESGGKGFIAIDDILLTPGLCGGEKTTEITNTVL